MKERQQEEVGLIAPKSIRLAVQSPLEKHLADFKADLTTLGRDTRYIYELGNRVSRLMRECKWEHIRDITPDSFQKWRSKQSLAGKTLNEYLTSLISLLNWMEKYQGIERNPTCHVDKIDIAEVEIRPRRAYKHDQITSLFEVSGPRKVIYLTAAHTGLRREELKQMEVDDLHLEAKMPFVHVRASTTKNKKVAMVALHPDVVTELRKLPLVPGTKFRRAAKNDDYQKGSRTRRDSVH